MILFAATMVETAGFVAIGIATVAMFLAFIRLVRGPSLPDRVVALDLIGVMSVGIIAAYDVMTEQPVLLDAATVLALVAFLGTVAFAHYVERTGSNG